MLTDEKIIQLKDLTVKPGKKIKLKDFSTKYKGKTLTKADSELMLENGRKHLAEVQDELYAHNRFFCSFFDTFKKNFRMIVPLSVRFFSNRLICL